MITGNGDHNHSSEECQSMEVEIDNDTFGVIITDEDWGWQIQTVQNCITE